MIKQVINSFFVIFGILTGFLGIVYILLMFLFIIFPKLHDKFLKWGNKIHFGKKPKCSLCGIEARDELIRNGKNRIIFCRNHLIQEFKKGFLSFSHRMVIFHPEQERTFCSSMYPYFPLTDMISEFNFDQKVVGKMKQALELTKGKCSSCKKQAEVIYFPKGVLQWDKSYGPKIEEVEIKKGKILCKKCTLSNIIPDLKANKESFVEGLILPYKREGVFVNTYL